jgi:hypothetical protein
MSISKNMDFPTPGKQKYSDLAKSVPVSSELPTGSFLPVPGPQGPKGDRGDRGPAGPDGAVGPQGPKGDDGKPGKNGKDGKDGKSISSPSNQNHGWAEYVNLKLSDIRCGADRGEDGWVQIYMDSIEKREAFIPKDCNALYNFNTRRISFKSLEVGAIVDIIYNLEVITFSPNTEIWLRSRLNSLSKSPTSFVALFKYQHSYDVTVLQKITVDSEADRIHGAVAEIRTDMDSIVRIKSIKILVS